MPHFFINSKTKNNNIITISDNENYRHIARSLRARTGEKLLLIDENQIQYETVIKSITGSEITCEITKLYPSMRDLDFDLFLAQSPLKGDSQLTIAEKSAELGVRALYPIITDNCTMNFDIASKKQEKWQKIMYEASKQCERAKVPECFKPQNIEQVLQNRFDRVIVFAEHSAEISLKKYLKQNPIKKGEKFLVIIGPEGGFSPAEFDYFKSKKFPLITLGNLILKAETAVITALGDIIYEYQG